MTNSEIIFAYWDCPLMYSTSVQHQKMFNFLSCLHQHVDKQMAMQGKALTIINAEIASLRSSDRN